MRYNGTCDPRDPKNVPLQQGVPNRGVSQVRKLGISWVDLRLDFMPQILHRILNQSYHLQSEELVVNTCGNSHVDHDFSTPYSQ